jgi:hypothetical protein
MGSVFSIKNTWCIVTAGHVFSDLEDYVRNRRVEIRAQTLADFFSMTSGTTAPIPFDDADGKKVWRDEWGLDFTVIPLGEMYRELLEANNVVPFREATWSPPTGVDFYQYRLLGFPDHLVQENRLTSDQPLTGFVLPVLALVMPTPGGRVSRRCLSRITK